MKVNYLIESNWNKELIKIVAIIWNKQLIKIVAITGKGLYATCGIEQS